jgi:hypothetical protein
VAFLPQSPLQDSCEGHVVFHDKQAHGPMMAAGSVKLT